MHQKLWINFIRSCFHNWTIRQVPDLPFFCCCIFKLTNKLSEEPIYRVPVCFITVSGTFYQARCATRKMHLKKDYPDNQHEIKLIFLFSLIDPSTALDLLMLPASALHIAVVTTDSLTRRTFHRFSFFYYFSWAKSALIQKKCKK